MALPATKPKQQDKVSYLEMLRSRWGAETALRLYSEALPEKKVVYDNLAGKHGADRTYDMLLDVLVEQAIGGRPLAAGEPVLPGRPRPEPGVQDLGTFYLKPAGRQPVSEERFAPLPEVTVPGKPPEVSFAEPEAPTWPRAVTEPERPLDLRRAGERAFGGAVENWRSFAQSHPRRVNRMMRDMLHLPSREDAVELIEAGKWDELGKLGTRGLFPNRAELGDWYVDAKLKTLQGQGKRGQAAAKLLQKLTTEAKYSNVRRADFPPFDLISQEWVAEHPTAAILPLAITAPTERLAYDATHPETWPGMAVMLLAGRYVLAPAMKGGFAWLAKQGWATQERSLGEIFRTIATRLKSKKIPLSQEMITQMHAVKPEIDPAVVKVYKGMSAKQRSAAWKAAMRGKPVRIVVPRGVAKAPAAPIVPPAPAGPIAPEMALALRGEAGIRVPPVVTPLAPEVPGEIVPRAGPPAEMPVAVPEMPAEGLAPGVPVAERVPTPPEIAPRVEPEAAAAPARIPAPPARTPNLADQITNEYNSVIADPSLRGQFTSTHETLRIGVSNAMERLRDIDTAPLFRTMPDGNLYALPIEGGYAVMPRFGLTFSEDIYGPGAMGEVFDIPGYDPSQEYRKVWVRKPAIFKSDASGQKWTLQEKGVLDIGREWPPPTETPPPAPEIAPTVEPQVPAAPKPTEEIAIARSPSEALAAGAMSPWLTDRDDVAAMVKQHGDFTVIVKDVNGNRAAMSASKYVQLQQSEPFMDRVREVWIKYDVPIKQTKWETARYQEGFMHGLKPTEMLAEVKQAKKKTEITSIEGIQLTNNSTVSRPQQAKFVEMVRDPRVQRLLRGRAIKEVRIEAPYKFDLSEDANIDTKAAIIRINADAVDPTNSILHELGHQYLETAPAEEKARLIEKAKTSTQASVQGYLKIGKYEEAAAELIYTDDAFLGTAIEVPAPEITPTPEEAVTPPTETPPPAPAAPVEQPLPTEADAQAARYKTREDYAGEMKEDVAAAHDAGEAGFVRVPGLEEFSELGNRIRGRMNRMLEPQRDVVRDVHGAIEKWRGETNLAGYYADWSQEVLNKMGVPKNERELVTRYIDSPDKYGPEFEKLPGNVQELAKELRRDYDGMWEVANQAGVLDSWRENYINRIYKDNEARIKRTLYPAGGQLGKGFRFAKQRKFETLDEAEAAGLHPILDPILLNGIYKYQLYRAIANRNLVQMLTQLQREDGMPLIMGRPKKKAKLKVWENEYQSVQAPGLAKYMWVGETGDKGMLVKIPAKADPEVAKVLNDVFSPWTPRNKWSQALRAVRGRVKRVVMLNPAIHGWNILSDVIDEVNFNPYATAKVYVRGHQLYKAKDALVEDAIANGLQMTSGQMVAQRLRQEALEIAPAMRGVLEPIGKLEQLSDKWLWSGIVRNAQLGLYETMTKQLAKKHPDWSSEQVGQTAASYINTNLGTLPWTWMSKGMREAGSFFFFARNWTFSNPDMVVKAATFGRKGLGMKALTPEQQTEIGTRFSKHLFKGMIGLVAFTNLLQLAFLTITNKMKEDGVLDGTPVPLHTSFQNEKGHWMDVDTGLATKTGQRIYIVPPLFRYMRDYIGYGTDIKNLEGRTLWNKMEPLLKAFGENLANYSVWQRQEIAKPGAPTFDRIKQRARYFVESITPSAYYARRPGRVKTKFEYFVPFTGTWIRRGAPGGRFAQLYFEFQKERKYEKDQLDNRIDEALQSGEFLEAIESMNQRYTSPQAKADRITRLVTPLNYFWDTANKKDKALFLAYLKKHNYQWEDFAGALTEERLEIEGRPDEEPVEKPVEEFPVGVPIETVPEGTQGSEVTIPTWWKKAE